MKTIAFFILALPGLAVMAQVPQAFSFQGVANDVDGAPLSEIQLIVQIDILESAMAQSPTYQEEHTVMTNDNGLYSLSVGLGVATVGDFSDIKWSEGDKFIRVSLDSEGNGDFVEAGTTQLLSVPYALEAGAAPTTPRVAVNNTAISGMNQLSINTAVFPGVNVNYFYEWLDGTPEDVTIEFDGLPDNLCIKTFGYNNTSLDFNNSFILSTNGIQEIPGGFMTPQTRLEVCDPSLGLVNGIYDLTLVFKTGELALDSLDYVLTIGNPPIYASCYPSLPITMDLVENTCDVNDVVLLSSVTVSQSTTTYMNVSSPFDASQSLDVEVFVTSQGYCRFNEDYPFDLPSNFDFAFLQVREELPNLGMEFNLTYELTGTPQSQSCRFKYRH